MGKAKVDVFERVRLQVGQHPLRTALENLRDESHPIQEVVKALKAQGFSATIEYFIDIPKLHCQGVSLNWVSRTHLQDFTPHTPRKYTSEEIEGVYAELSAKLEIPGHPFALS